MEQLSAKHVIVKTKEYSVEAHRTRQFYVNLHMLLWMCFTKEELQVP